MLPETPVSDPAIDFADDRPLEPAAFVDLLKRSGLAARRPVGDSKRIEAMLAHANLTVTAWDGDILAGISRCLTDFAYVCYCSDLAVDKAYQGRGIGQALLKQTMLRLHSDASLYLRSAPDAVSFYDTVGARIGLERADRFYQMKAGRR